jgi:hypothetical protein
MVERVWETANDFEFFHSRESVVCCVQTLLPWQMFLSVFYVLSVYIYHKWYSIDPFYED